MTALESWRWKDPARVYERIEAQEQAKAARATDGKQERAKRELEKLFKEKPGDDKPN